MADAPAPVLTYAQRTAQVSQHTVVLSSGRSLSYWEEGAQNDVPIIFLHGAGCGKDIWLQKALLLGVRLIAVDRPGYRRTEYTAPLFVSTTNVVRH